MLTRQPTCLIVYISISAVFSVMLFLQGFFPMKNPVGKIAVADDLPQSIAGTSVNVTSVYPQHIGRVVIMVIDAFRWDFVQGSEGHQNMPYTASVIEKEEACFLPMKAAPPTVTMPRIKALATGTVPNFIDVVLNLGSGQVSEDSFLRQAKEHGRKMIFFGDDTWLKMFPDMFVRSDGTTSFFVSDFTEVDNNVTRHLDLELTSTDWDIMVLHYLGLDHIGHLEGPRSPLIRPKLNEMDAVVQHIHTMLKQWDKTSDFPSLLLVCGDHGMKNSGGHGGADPEEIMIPLIVIGQICKENTGRNINTEYSQRDRVLQIDVAPTMAVLMGLPIPSSSLGKIIPEIIKNLDTSQQLYALHYNSKQLSDQFEMQHKYTSRESLVKMQKAIELHAQYLKNNASYHGQETEIARLYVSALDKMSTELAESLITFDMNCLFIGAALLWQLAIAMLQDVQYCSINGLFIFFSTAMVVSAERIYCLLNSSISLFCSSISLPFLVALIFGININLMGQISFSPLTKIAKALRDDQVSLTFVIGTLLHSISLASSSFIEEEHQTWYFLWPTFGFTVLYQLLGGTYLQKQSSYLSLKNRKTLEKQIYHMASQWVIILISHRLLQSWNHTGAQWAFIANIDQDHKNIASSMVLILGLCGIFWCCCSQSIQNKHSQLEKILDTLIYFSAAASIYCYHCAVGNVLLPFPYSASRGVKEVRLFWCTMIVLIIKQCGSAFYARKYLREWNGWHMVVSSWLLLSSLTQRPHNVILLWAQVKISECLWSFNLHHNRIEIQPYWLAAAHTWLGNIFYFYQGKSNSLATIDIATAYVGQEDYNIFSVGSLLIINTYSAPVLSHLLLVSACVSQTKSFSSPRFKETLWKAFHCEVCLRLLPLALYVSLMIALRYHLFVWSVFSPKLLYESTHTLMLAVLLILTKIILLLFCSYQSVNLNEHLDIHKEQTFS